MWWIIGFIGWAMTFYGVYLLGNKKIRGFYWTLASEVPLILDAALFGHLSLICASVVFSCLNIRNIIKWKRQPWAEDFESDFFARNPQYTMQVLRDNQGISVDISHDTHDYLDAYVQTNFIDGANENEMRRQTIQIILDRNGEKA